MGKYFLNFGCIPDNSTWDGGGNFCLASRREGDFAGRFFRERDRDRLPPNTPGVIPQASFSSR